MPVEKEVELRLNFANFAVLDVPVKSKLDSTLLHLFCRVPVGLSEGTSGAKGAGLGLSLGRLMGVRGGGG